MWETVSWCWAVDEVQLFLWCCGRVTLARSSHGIVFVCLVVVSLCLFCQYLVSTLCSGHRIRDVAFLNENKGNKEWNITDYQLLCLFCSSVALQNKTTVVPQATPCWLYDGGLISTYKHPSVQYQILELHTQLLHDAFMSIIHSRSY